MEFLLSVLASIVAAGLLAVIAVLLRKVRESARELSIMDMTTGTVPDVSGRWTVSFERTRDGENSTAHASVSLQQHGRALLGTISVPDLGNIQYRFRGVFTGDTVTGYFWTRLDRGDTGTFFLRSSPGTRVLRGSYTGVSWDRTVVTGRMDWERKGEESPTST